MFWLFAILVPLYIYPDPVMKDPPCTHIITGNFEIIYDGV